MVAEGGAMLETRQLFLLSLSLFHNEEAIEDKENREEMVWSLRKWGAASTALVVFVLFSSPRSWNALSSLVLDLDELVEVSASQSCEVYQCSNLSSFKTAPFFRNEKTCAVSVRDIDFVCDPASMHIALTLDAAYLRGSMAVVHSILQHASCPEAIVFHFLLSDADEEFRSLIKSTFPYLKFKIYHFNDGLVRNRISSSVRQALEQPLNYARNYLADILEPCVRRVIYLDSDLVLVDDIAKLWGTSLSSKTLGAPEYCHANFSKYFTSSFWSNKTLADTFKGRRICYFNTGVMIIDLVKWRQKRYTLKIEKWMEIQKDRRIYDLGSLPPFLLVFAGLIEPVEHRWNQHGLGGDNVKGSCRPLHPGPVSLLHWSGTGKPWTRLDSGRPCPLDSLWLPYDLYVSPAQSHI